jgi:hypothetical protein
LSRTWFVSLSQKVSSGPDKIAMPKFTWFSTRFCVIRLSRPPVTAIPFPNKGYWSASTGAAVLLLSWTQFPAITASR